MSIWEHKKVKKLINAKNYYSLGEGFTPTNSFDDSSNKLHFKREDLNPTGSWKDRATAYKLTKLVANNVKKVVIASSGNAAISLLTYISKLKLQIDVHVVVSPKVDEKKKTILEDISKLSKSKIYYEERAKSFSVKLALKLGGVLIKSSTDEDLSSAYISLGLEINKHINIDKNNIVFASASSGTAAVGIIRGVNSKYDLEKQNIRFVVTQTQSCAPLVAEFNQILLPFKEPSLADAIVDKSMLRKYQLIKSLDLTNGDALAIKNPELEEASDFVSKLGLTETLSYNSLLPVAGYLRLRHKLVESNIILIISGT